MILGGHFPPSAVESGLASLVSGLNARHPGYRWQVLPLDPARDDQRPSLDGETTAREVLVVGEVGDLLAELPRVGRDGVPLDLWRAASLTATPSNPAPEPERLAVVRRLHELKKQLEEGRRYPHNPKESE